MMKVSIFSKALEIAKDLKINGKNSCSFSTYDEYTWEIDNEFIWFTFKYYIFNGFDDTFDFEIPIEYLSMTKKEYVEAEKLKKIRIKKEAEEHKKRIELEKLEQEEKEEYELYKKLKEKFERGQQ